MGGNTMKMTFRWYGESDPVTLKQIKQLPGMHGIVSAIYDVPVGEVWPLSKLDSLKRKIESESLAFDVIESVPVHEDIKLGLSTRDYYINNYKETIRNVAKVGISVICYNFMPVFDWTRTQLDKELSDGSTALVYYQSQLTDIDPETNHLSLPGWDASYTHNELKGLIAQYKDLGEEQLWDNLTYFLNEIIPVAEECDVKMAIHPDDPPWRIFGIPRIITNEQNLDRLLQLYDSPANGLTLCSGSLGCSSKNDVASLVRKYAKQKRIHFGHMRNVKVFENGDFEESAHYTSTGSLDMVDILKAYHENDFDGFIRPDHGRMIWGETGRPGYGLYDRGLGAMYLLGIWETLKKI